VQRAPLGGVEADHAHEGDQHRSHSSSRGELGLRQRFPPERRDSGSNRRPGTVLELIEQRQEALWTPFRSGLQQGVQAGGQRVTQAATQRSTNVDALIVVRKVFGFRARGERQHGRAQCVPVCRGPCPPLEHLG
jgi:hypothetical protein